jgi:hypothetical protein
MRVILFLVVALATGLDVHAGEVEAVYARTMNGYVRRRLADGTWAPETYVFKKGDYWGGFVAGDAMDKLSFENIAREISGVLAKDRYVLSAGREEAQLLMVLSWGIAGPMDRRSNPEVDLVRQQASAEQAFFQELAELSVRPAKVNSPKNPAPPRNSAAPGESPRSGIGNQEGVDAERFAEQIADSQSMLAAMTNRQNASMMGFSSATDPELEGMRYFVALQAFDYQLVLQRRKSKLLWEARFSIRERGAFGERLAAMASGAARFLGNNTNGLQYRSLPEGHVEIGEIRSLGFLPNPASVTLAPDGAHVAYLRGTRSSLSLVIVAIDRSRRVSTASVSMLASPLLRLTWADPSHVILASSVLPPVCFGLDGNVAALGEERPPPSAADRSSATAFDRARVESEANDKFPHRKVLVIASGDAGRRILLNVGGGAGPDRFFVWDLPTDLLYEVTRSEFSL